MRSALIAACLFAGACLPAGEALFNGSLGLGEPGQAAPGFYLRQFLRPGSSADQASGLVPVVADDGAGGRCLRVPGIPGRLEYNLATERFRIEADGEVEVSFRIRTRDAEDGYWDPAPTVIVDFRAFDLQAYDWKPASERYPVLTGFQVRPTDAWTTHRKRLRARGGFPYEMAFRCSARPGAAVLDGLEIADLSVRPVDAPAAPGDEAVAVPDRDPPVYGHAEPVTLRVAARLAGWQNGAVQALLVDDADGRTVASRDLDLEPVGGPDAAGRRLGVATWTLTPGRYGSFSTRLLRAGRDVRSTGGDLVVVRPRVAHPPGSPGASLGGDVDGIHTSLQVARSAEPVVHTPGPRPGGEIALYAQAGAQTLRLWADWNLVEPEPGAFRGDILGRDLDAIIAGGMQPLLVLGTTFTNTPKPDADPPKGRLPPWLVRRATVRPGVVLPPLPEWERYVAACLRLFGGRVRNWEVVNEAANGWTADEYLPLLESAHRLIKAADPGAVVVGNGATGDLGLRPLDWTRALAARRHERFLDVVAFHPYEAVLDLQGADRFKYRDVVAGIRALLSEPRPMWCTEAYYLVSAGRQQGRNGEDQARYGAGDLQRHYLDGLCNGVALSTSPTWISLVKNRRSVPGNLIPNEVFAGVNALSGLLSGARRLERVEVNPLVRSGVFLGDGAEALGFAYDLRPGGSRWQAPAAAFAGIAVLDLFGNPQPESGLRLGTDPVFLRGPAPALRALFAASRWQVAEPLALTGRSLAGRLHLEAINRTGTASGAVVAFPGSGLPEVGCSFRGPERFAAVLPALALPPALAWIASADGEQAAGGSLAAPAPGRETVLVLDAPLRATLARGSVLGITARLDRLVITAEVPEPDPVAAPGDALHEGSALEVFLDAAPGFRPDCDRVADGAEKMPVTQYIAAALPSATGRTLWSQAHRRPGAASGAQSVRSRTASGWQVTLEIPWEDVVPPAGMAPEAIGLDVELDRRGADGRPGKEAWGPLPGESWRRRAHYPVLVLPPEVVARLREPARAVAVHGGAPVVDGGFEAGMGWQARGGADGPRVAAGAGFAGTAGLDLMVAPDVAVAPGHLRSLWQRLPCRQHAGREVRLTFLLRLTDLRAAAATDPAGYPCGFTAQIHYRDGISGTELENDGIGLRSPVLGSHDWRLVSVRSRIPGNATEITLNLGTRGPVSGRVQVDEVEVSYPDP